MIYPTFTISYEQKTHREDDSQATADILLANQDHLELLHLVISGNELVSHFLPPNLKFLRVGRYRYHSNINPASTVIEMAAKQCPKLCGVVFYGTLSLRIINAISRFEKFVANLLFLAYTKCAKSILFSALNFLGFVLIQIMKKSSELRLVLGASTIFRAWYLGAKISRFSYFFGQIIF